MGSDLYFLDQAHTDPARLQAERNKARVLRRSHWWKARIAKGTCHYCGSTFSPDALTLDHVVPLARGGRTTKGNVVPACRACNGGKKLDTPVDLLLTHGDDEPNLR